MPVFRPIRHRRRASARGVCAVLAAVVLALVVGSPMLLGAELPGGGQQQEYFVRQQADEALLIRIDGFEAQFESSVYDTAGERLIASGVPGSRVAPLFQYVSTADRERQLDIRITAPFDTSRSRFDLGLSRITIRDDRSARLARAYQWLSFGLELPPADTAANWSIKVGSLNEAARAFESFGMEELQLWASYFAARLSYTGLGDNGLALEIAEAILSSPGARRLDRVRMAAARLRSEVLAALRRSGELPPTGGSTDPVQAAAQDAAALAASLGLLFERADALYLAGQDLADRGQFAEALQRFEESLDIADTIEADDLATAVRERLVDIHGQQGDVSATSEVLQAIESQLVEDGANDELAQNLLAQGRILNDTYRHEAARSVLRQALAFEHNSATRNQVRLALAEASWALGDLDEAWAQARAAVTNPDTGDFRRPTAVLDVQRGVAVMAGVARARNERQRLRELRDAQRQLLDGAQERTGWAWERAQDELETGRPADAAPFLRQVRDASGGPAQAPLGNLARLWLCRLGTDCTGDTAARAWQALRGSGIPRYRIEGARLRARLMLDAGRTGEAARALESLVRDITFLRYSIPGVLGDQHWRRVDVIASDLLSARRATGRDDLLLLDLARLRWLRASDGALGLPFDRGVAGLDTDAFRAILARREQPGPGDDVTTLAREIEAQLTDGRARFDAATSFLDESGQAAWLAALEADAAVLDFDLSGNQALALLADGRGVRRYSLGPASAFDDWPRLLEALPSMDDAALAAAAGRWGRRFLAPLSGRLPSRVYLATADALGYLPFERFLLDGEPLAARHSLVRLASYPARTGPAMRLAAFTPQSVFLAGTPVDFSAGFLARLETGEELRSVMNRFVGPGLQVIQGTALAPDEFRTTAFRAADLVHLAMPARVSLVRPATSALELSEPRGGAGRYLEPATALTGWTLDAHLLVLSQARIEGAVVRSPGRPPLVAGALASGSGAVMASAWAGTEAGSAAFMDAFYAALERGRSLDQALADAREALSGTPREALRHQLWVD